MNYYYDLSPTAAVLLTAVLVATIGVVVVGVIVGQVEVLGAGVEGQAHALQEQI